MLSIIPVLILVPALSGQMEKGAFQPEIFAPGVVSTPAGEEAALAISPDGQEVFFGRSGAICQSRWRDGKWSDPERLPFTGQYGDYYPCLSPNGRKLYFTSNRPTSPGQPKSDNYDIWVAMRTADGWSEPENLGSPVNTPEAEVYCSIAGDGSIFFGSGSRDGRRHIMYSKLVDGKFGAPESLGPNINTRAFQGYHAVPPDARFIIFTSNRPGGFGGLDLYVSYRTSGGWREPVNLGARINTAADESHASISPDGRYLFFASNRATFDKSEQSANKKPGGRDIYRVLISDLELKPPAWVQKRNLPEARIFEIAAAIEGVIYCVTSGEDGKPGTEVHAYDPATDTWSTKSHANLIRHSFGAGELEGKIYIWGGVAGNRLVNSTEMYDPKVDKWTVKADFPRPRIFAKGGAVDGKLYAVGGIRPPGRNQVPLIDAYDPKTNRWTRKASMILKRDAYRVAVADGKIYVVGNLGDDARILQYDPTTDKWAIKSPMPTPRFDFGIHASGGLIYTFGGMGRDTLEVYDAVADRWIAKPSMPRKNWEQVAAEVNGSIYVIGGGFPAGSVLDVLYRYDPAVDQ